MRLLRDQELLSQELDHAYINKGMLEDRLQKLLNKTEEDNSDKSNNKTKNSLIKQKHK